MVIFRIYAAKGPGSMSAYFLICNLKAQPGRTRGIFLSSACEQQASTQGSTESTRGPTAGLACALSHVPLTFIHNGVSSPNGNPAHREATR